ncbi:sialidase family protein [Porifericola rhodea]|uniref:sialidase family protein n=1 Tax=Porifericola rhodea TaxID=930972 RepID=UPI0026666462|nr:sialidase family protein [Porifericola rhodea]WKN30230.1 sialidase family protein [Porifericola rhodea]
MLSIEKTLLSLFISTLLSIATLAQEVPQVPGTIVSYSPASSQKYIGSPSICILPNGNYVASHDHFGKGSTEHEKARSFVFLSTDKGASWNPLAEIDGQFWSKLFYHQGALYLLGTDKHHGDMIIRRSEDEGRTWTEPKNKKNGLILKGEYHCAPTPIILHNGRLWRAMENAKAPTTKWGERYSTFMMSIPEDADLLHAKNWTSSEQLSYHANYLEGDFGGWLEGNAVVGPDGKILNILRVDNRAENAEDKAAIVLISEDGKKASFNPDNGFMDMPGGSKKFTISYDSLSQKYWMIANYIPQKYKVEEKPARIRNTQALCSSDDLKTWNVHKILLQHPDVEKHGFQYVDWLFEGDDLIYLSRTAFDDDKGGANNFHDANFLTFHRIKNFRQFAQQSISE